MPISTTCPNCKAIFRLAEELAGRKVKCQKCQSLFVIPRPDCATVEPGARVPDAADSAESPRLNSGPNVPFVPPPTSSPFPLEKAVAAVTEDDGADPKRARVDPDDRPRRRDRGPRRDEIEKPRSKALMVVLALVGVGVFACVAVIGVAVISELMREDRPQQAQRRVIGRNNNQVIVQKDINGNPVRRGGFHPGPVRPVNENPTTEIKLDDKGVFRLETELNLKDPPNPDKKRHKHFAIRLEEGKRYQIDMEVAEDGVGRKQFDAFLYLIDDANVIVAENDDIVPVENQDSRIIYPCPRTGIYKIEATFFDNNVMAEFGSFTLTVRELKEP